MDRDLDPQFVYVVRVDPDISDDIHVFANHDDAHTARDIIGGGTSVSEEPVLDSGFLNVLRDNYEEDRS